MTSVTWGDSASDWNGGTDDGTVHESTSNTDHDDDTLLKRGYQISNPYKSSNLDGYWPFHEDSGSTANDFSGDNVDGTYNGPTLGQTGLLSATSPDYDGSNDYTTHPQLTQDLTSSGWTVTCWVRPEGAGGSKVTMWHPRDQADLELQKDGNDKAVFKFWDGSSNHRATGSTTLSTDGSTWYFLCGTANGDDWSIWVDATKEATVNTTARPKSTDATSNWGRKDGGSGRDYNGKLMEGRVYDVALSSSEIQTLYDVVDKPGIHHSSTKTA